MDAGAKNGAKGRRSSLRTPLVLFVLLVNLIAFAAIGVAIEYAARSDRRDISLDFSKQFAEHMDDIVDAFGQLRPDTLLDWRGWRNFKDVLVAQSPRRLEDGTYVVDGIHVNPLGRSHRTERFDKQHVLELIARAVRNNGAVDSGSGTAVPIRDPSGGIWGGAWIVKQPISATEMPTLTILPIMAGMLLLMTAVLLWILQRWIIDPVEGIAGAVHRLEAGDLSARVPTSTDRTDELGQLSSGFNDMASQLERYNQDLEAAVAEATEKARSAEAAAMTQRRLAATGELAAGIAHELNNPLGGLTNAVEALKREDLAPGRREEYLSLVSHGLHRMGETVGRLLRLSPRAAEIDDVHLWRPLSDALGLVRHRADTNGVEIWLRGPDDGGEARPAFEADVLAPFHTLPPLRGAANELGQAVLNLLVNAIDAIEEAREDGAATRGPGRIDVTLTHGPDGGLMLMCEDDGPGVSAEVLERAAHAFFTTKSQGKGTGLGLAIVHNVVAAHGGRVLLDGGPGMGFRVTLELPLEAFGQDDPADGEPLPDGASAS